MLGAVYNAIGNCNCTEDAIQEAFISAWLHLASLKSPEKFGIWVSTIAVNRAKRLLRAARVADVSLNELGDCIPENEKDVYAQAREKDELYYALGTLSEALRRTVELYYFEEMSVKEISAMLGVSIGTVKWRLSEGRRKLRKGYGVIMKNENIRALDSMTDRVMKKVREIEMMKMKNCRSGLEDILREALNDIETIPEMDKRQFATAQALFWEKYLRSYDINNEDLALLKKASLAGRNEEIMSYVLNSESKHMDGREKIDYIKNVQIPFCEENGLVHARGRLYFLMGLEYLWEARYEEALPIFQDVGTLVPKNSAAYANTVSAISLCERMTSSEVSDGMLNTVKGEHLKLFDGDIYFYETEGIVFSNTLLEAASRCDGCIIDQGLSVGESRMSSCGRVTLTFKADGEKTSSPAGDFENCRVYEVCGRYNGFTEVCTTWFAEGCGIVRQEVKNDNGERTMLLSSYSVAKATGYLPARENDRWEYVGCEERDDGRSECKCSYSVTYSDDADIFLASDFAEIKDSDKRL